MKLRELLGIIQQVSIDNETSTPLICGGTPRDRVLNKLSNIDDLDITTGDKTIHNLAKSVGIELSKTYQITTKQADDGHTSLIFPGNKFKLDFSSNFIVDNIDKILFKYGIKNPTDMQKELFSRDFTCNTLLMSMDLKKITDPTHLGINDIKKKILKTCLDPNLTLRVNTNRIIRVVYLSSKLDFDVDQSIIDWIIKNKDLIRLSSDTFLSKNIDKALSKNSDRAIYLINKLNLWDILPITDNLRPFLSKKDAQRNFDYGQGFYANMSKYDSIFDFRKSRRKKRKKIFKNIRKMKLK